MEQMIRYNHSCPTASHNNTIQRTLGTIPGSNSGENTISNPSCSNPNGLMGQRWIKPFYELQKLPKTIEKYMKNHSDTLPIMRTTKLQDHTPRSIPSATPIERTTKLPDLTTEDLMDIIHAATHKDNQDKKHQATTSMTPRTSVDVYYVACSTYYHFWRNCDFLAKLLKSLDFLNNLDPAKKKVVMDTFHTKQQ
jgi:hypothetical protein